MASQLKRVVVKAPAAFDGALAEAVASGSTVVLLFTGESDASGTSWCATQERWDAARCGALHRESILHRVERRRGDRAAKLSPRAAALACAAHRTMPRSYVI
jgi:hypothetical protein